MPDGNTDTGPKRASSPEADFGAVCWCEGDIAKNRDVRLEGAIRQCRAGATRNPAVRHAIYEIGGQDRLRRRRSASQQNDESECR